MPAQGLGPQQCLATVRDAEFAVDVPDVVFDGARRNEQLVGDLLIGEPPAETIEHIRLAMCEECQIGQGVIPFRDGTICWSVYFFNFTFEEPREKRRYLHIGGCAPQAR